MALNDEESVMNDEESLMKDVFTATGSGEVEDVTNKLNRQRDYL